MKVLITGARGQLGHELRRTAPADTELCAVDVDELDIVDREATAAFVGRLAPALIVNAAAYTAVDRAEDDRDVAFAVNERGARHLAEAAAAAGARLFHVSTDFVFDGQRSRPYPPDAPAAPLSVYGASKAAGDAAVLEATAGGALVLRTAWVYSAHGANFVKTVLRLCRERPSFGVVADQVGTPTWARSLAEALWAAARRPEMAGVHHYTDAGVASWYDLAVAVREEALALGLCRSAGEVLPIRTEDYPLPARRPAYSVLDKTATWKALGVVPRHWRDSLRRMLAELREAGG